MKYPTCKEVNLVMSNRESIEIDYCPDCRGIWLDRGELDKIIERSKTQPAQQKYKERESKPYAQGSQGSNEYYKKGKCLGGAEKQQRKMGRRFGYQTS